MKIKEINQIGLVVHDATRVAQSFQHLFNLNPAVTLDTTITQDFEGQPIAPYTIRIALHTLGPLQVEFIQVLEGRPAIYCDFQDQSGEGLHHLGVFVPDLEKALQLAEKEGIENLWSGDIYGVRFVYLDTRAQLGTILEFIELRSSKAE